MSLINDICGCNSTGAVTCSGVNACIDKQLVRVAAALESALPNFCPAVAKCTDAQLALIAAGSANSLPNFDDAIYKTLRTLPGFITTGNIFLSLHNNVFEWQTVAGAGGGYTDEQAQDAIGLILGPEFTYSDSTPSITLDVLNGLSKGGYVQLGQTVGAVGNPAALITNTELPLGDYYLLFNNKTGTGSDIASIKLVTTNALGDNLASVDLTAKNTVSVDMSVNNIAGIMQTTYTGLGGVALGQSGYFVSGSSGHFFLADMRGTTTHSSVEVGGTAMQTWVTSGDTLLGLFGTKNTGFGGVVSPTASVDIAASTMTRVPLRITAGVDPTSNYLEGGIWQSSDLHLYARLGGVNKRLDNDYNFTPDSFIQNQIALAQPIASYWIDGAARVDTYLQLNDVGRFIKNGTLLSLVSPAAPARGGILSTGRLYMQYENVDNTFSNGYFRAGLGGSNFIDVVTPTFSIYGESLNFSTTISPTAPAINVGGLYPLKITAASQDGVVDEINILELYKYNSSVFSVGTNQVSKSRQAYVFNREGVIKTQYGRIGVDVLDFTNAAYKGDIVFEAVDATINTGTPTEYLRIKSDGRIIVKSLDTDSVAPTTTGTTRMVICDSAGLLSFTTIPSGGGSGVTSVGLSMPTAFTVTNTPVTSSGTLTVTGAGTTAQYIRGDGSLATLPTTTALSSITAAAANASIDNTDKVITWAWNNISSGAGFNITSSSTVAASGSSALSVALTGANSSSAITTSGVKVSNAKTGTTSVNLGLESAVSGGASENTAGKFTASGAGVLNRGGYFTASGASSNQAAYFDAGDVVMATLANLSTQNRIVGQDSATTKLGYITIGSGLSLAGGVLTATGGGGSDTNFAITNLTASGNRSHDWASFDLTFINIDDLAMTAATSMTFTCAAISLPSVTNLATQDRLLGQFSTGGRVGYVSIGSGLDLTAGTLSVTSSGGSVTNVAVTSLAPLFTTNVTNPTTSASVAYTLTNAGANTWFGNNTGSGAAPAYNAAGTVSKADDTNVTIAVTGGSNSVLSNVTLTMGWTSTLGVARGGTNIGSYTIGDTTWASGATTISKLGIGTAGQLYRVNAGATAPEWFTPTYLTAALTTLNTLTAATQTFATGTSGSDFNISSVTATHTFNIPDAGASARGLTTTGAQIFAGAKTFNVGVVINETGAASDTRIESDANANMVFVDGTNNRVGIGTGTPAYVLDVIGNTQITSGSLGIGTTPTTAAPLTIAGSGYTSGGIVLLPSISATAGSSPSIIGVTGTIIEAASGTHTIIAGVNITPPTITGGLAAVTNAASLYISGATTATVSVGNFAILVNSGASKFGGDVLLASGVAYTTGGYDLTVRNQATGRLETVDPDIIGLNTQSGSAYTLVLTDKGGMVRMTAVGANTLTVPPNSSVAFTIGTQILVYREGSGQTTVAAGAGVIINSADSATRLRVQHSVATLIKVATNTWILSGDIIV
jgi:hypothetical protein